MTAAQLMGSLLLDSVPHLFVLSPVMNNKTAEGLLKKCLPYMIIFGEVRVG